MEFDEYTCPTCHTAVRDRLTHEKWHKELTEWIDSDQEARKEKAAQDKAAEKAVAK